MITQQTIDQVKDKLVKEFNPVEIYLYGPYIWGQPDEEDEAELEILMVVDELDEGRYNMLVRGHSALSKLDVPKDLRIFTKDEFAEFAQESPRLSFKIKTKGKRVYAKA